MNVIQLALGASLVIIMPLHFGGNQTFGSGEVDSSGTIVGLPMKLPNGMYIIERVLPFKPRGFQNREDLENWRKTAEARQRHSEYFEILIVDDERVIRQMSRIDDRFVSVGTMFVCMTGDGGWIFNERANEVYLLSSEHSLEWNYGPMRAVVRTARRISEELELMGLHLINWKTVNYDERDLFFGQTPSGKEIIGGLVWDENSQVKGIGFAVESGQEYKIQVEWSLIGTWIERTEIRRERLPGSGYEPFLEYRILAHKKVPEEVSVKDYWERFQDRRTIVLRYDFDESRMVFRDSKREWREVGTGAEARTAFKVSRTSIIVMILCLTVPAVFLYSFVLTNKR